MNEKEKRLAGAKKKLQEYKALQQRQLHQETNKTPPIQNSNNFQNSLNSSINEPEISSQLVSLNNPFHPSSSHFENTNSNHSINSNSSISSNFSNEPMRSPLPIFPTNQNAEFGFQNESDKIVHENLNNLEQNSEKINSLHQNKVQENLDLINLSENQNQNILEDMQKNLNYTSSFENDFKSESEGPSISKITNFEPKIEENFNHQSEFEQNFQNFEKKDENLPIIAQENNFQNNIAYKNEADNFYQSQILVPKSNQSTHFENDENNFISNQSEQFYPPKIPENYTNQTQFPKITQNSTEVENNLNNSEMEEELKKIRLELSEFIAREKELNEKLFSTEIKLEDEIKKRVEKERVYDDMEKAFIKLSASKKELESNLDIEREKFSAIQLELTQKMAENEAIFERNAHLERNVFEIEELLKSKESESNSQHIQIVKLEKEIQDLTFELQQTHTFYNEQKNAQNERNNEPHQNSQSAQSSISQAEEAAVHFSAQHFNEHHLNNEHHQYNEQKNHEHNEHHQINEQKNNEHHQLNEHKNHEHNEHHQLNEQKNHEHNEHHQLNEHKNHEHNEHHQINEQKNHEHNEHHQLNEQKNHEHNEHHQFNEHNEHHQLNEHKNHEHHHHQLNEQHSAHAHNFNEQTHAHTCNEHTNTHAHAHTSNEHNNCNEHAHNFNEQTHEHSAHTLSNISNEGPSPLEKKMARLEWENVTYREELDKLGELLKIRRDESGLVDKLKEENEKLRAKSDELEHMVIHLQGENDTIGDYISLYQTQKKLLKEKYIERNQEMEKLGLERQELQIKMSELNALLTKFNKENLENSANQKPPVEKIKELVDLINNSNPAHFHPCSLCRGTLMNV